MEGKARIGRWVLIAIIIVIALSELTLAALGILTGRFRGGQVIRVLLTGWLLWKAWDGAALARWLMVGLFLVSAVFAAFIGVGALLVEDRPEIVALGVGLSAVCLAFGLSLSSPWVGAYQTARRGSLRAEQAATADRLRD